ncbi:MAG: hypothetical protein ABSG75_11155 [Syntrophales bacterium]|jgi:hypothetical protein
MIASLIGALLGGAFRCIPEILNFFDKKNERAHELSMQDKQMEYAKIQGEQKREEIGAQSQADWDKGTIDALKEAITSQNISFQKTGYAIVDFLMALAVFISSTIRPAVTYIVVGLYCGMKICLVIAAYQAGSGFVEIAKILWTEQDQGVLTGILNFWFLGRVFDKAKGSS